MSDTMRASARRIAGAVRESARRERERRPGRVRGEVISVSPLQVEVERYDLVLDEDDVSLGRSVKGYTNFTHEGFPHPGLQVGDVLVLVEVEDDEWVAVDVEED